MEPSVQLLGVAVAALIPTITWSSRRTTREGRLLLKLERLGRIYQSLPDGVERTHFGHHVAKTAAALNAWLDPETTRRRWLQRSLAGAVVAASIAAVIWVSPSLSPDAPLQSLAAGALIGGAAAPLMLLTNWLVDRRAAADSERRAEAALAAATRERLDKLHRQLAGLLDATGEND